MPNDKNTPLISVIVPVYATEKYLGKCLDSILSQTYKSIEVIIVNDASKDNSESIIKKYLREDDRIKCVRHTENRGLFRARLSGAEEASGEYIAFVDSDDYISCDFYRLLVNKAQDSGSDITVSDWAFEYPDGKKMIMNLDNFRRPDFELNGGEIADAFMGQRGECFSWHTVWNKLYKKSLWDKCVPFFEKCSKKRSHLIMCEDIVFSSALWLNARKVTAAAGAFYFYMQHEGQSVASGNIVKLKKNISDVKYAFEFFEEILREKGVFDKYSEDYAEFKALYARRWFDLCSKSEAPEEAFRAYDSAFSGMKREGTRPSDHFWGKYLTEAGHSFIWHEEIKYAICSPEVTTVSFDIFDTLITRPFSDPTDMFTLMNGEFNRLIGSTSYVDFREIRVEAEAGCREKNRFLYGGCEDITLDEIYDYMAESFLFPREVCEKVKKLEMQLELKFCTARSFGKELLELAVSQGKRVILISDMYLSAGFIGEILENNGISGYSDIFVSSEYRLLKGTGELYKKALSVCGIDDPQEVLHIGDNWNSDVVSAEKAGLRTYHLPNAREVFSGSHSSIYAGEGFSKVFAPNGEMRDSVRAYRDFTAIRCMTALAANKLCGSGYVTINKGSDFNCEPYRVGYYALGMHLLAVSRWLLDESEKNGYDTVHFVARDGYLPKKAFDILRDKLGKNVESDYFYISRKVTAPLQIRKTADLYSLRSIIYIYSFSPKKLIDVLRPVLKPDAVEKGSEICRENRFGYERNFTSEREYDRFIRLLADKFLSEERAAEYSAEVGKYFAKKIGANDAFFDIGYSARNESIFSVLLDRKINTYYIHTNQDIAFKRAKMFGFGLNSFYDLGPTACVVLREHIFCEQGPSCISYKSENGSIIPQFEEYKPHYKTRFVTEAMQQGALDFVRDFAETFGEFFDELPFRRSDASLPYEYFLHRAKWFDRQMFSESSFEDDMWGGTNVGFVAYWEDNLRKSGCLDRIKEAPAEAEKHISDPISGYFSAMKRQRISPEKTSGSCAFFLDVMGDEKLTESEKLEKCAGNTENLLFWDSIIKIASPDIIPNWYAYNSDGFADDEHGVFLTTNLVWIRENEDLTYLDRLLDNLGNKPLLPVAAGLSCEKEKRDFAFTPESLKTLARIAERCKTIGVRGDYTAEILAANGIKNCRVIGCPSLYGDMENYKKLSSPVKTAGVVRGSFKPFYGEFSDKEKELLCFFADNGFLLTRTTALPLKPENLGSEELFKKLDSYANSSRILFSDEEWKNSFKDAFFSMGMSFQSNVAALKAGVPALFVNYESSGRELCRYFGLPCIEAENFDSGRTVREYFEAADYTGFEERMKKKYAEFIGFLRENGVDPDGIMGKIIEK